MTVMFCAALIFLTIFWAGWFINHFLEAQNHINTVLRDGLADIDCDTWDEELDHA